MEQSAPTSTKVATKWSLIYCVVAIAITYVIEIAGMDINSPVKYVSYIFLLAFLFLAQKEYKAQLGGYIKFGEAFSIAIKYGLFVGIIMGVFIYVYLTFLSPEVLSKSIEAQRDAMAAKGLTPDQVDQGINIAKKYGGIFGAFGALIMYIIVRVIFGLIGAAILKKERSAYDPEPAASDPTV